MPRIEPPCPKCPKFLLHPDKTNGPYLGVHPKNQLIVHLYKMACGDIRVGTFDGAYLLGSLTPEAAMAVMAMYDDQFPTLQSQREAWEMMWLIDKVATATRAKEEDNARKAARQAAQAKTLNMPKGGGRRFGN